MAENSRREEPCGALGSVRALLQTALVVKTPPASAGGVRDPGSIPGSGRAPGGGQGKPLQCSCLENPMDRRAWWATVHSVAKSRTQLKRLSIHTHREENQILEHLRWAELQNSEPDLVNNLHSPVG